uniref:hypothetical protein n=1 Tax=Corallococcus coralloides TaxID=184914 RepID=UPI000FFE9864|nr:hypothetical protein [Corallococcus coralloides]
MKGAMGREASSLPWLRIDPDQDFDMSDEMVEPQQDSRRLPEYDEATAHLLLECFHGLSAAQDQVLGMMSHSATDAISSADMTPGITHGAHKGFEMEMRFILSDRAILSADVDEWAASVQDSVDSALPVLMGNIFGGIDKILSEAGQAVDAQGQPLSVEWVIKALEKIELNFDDEGNPQMPTLIAHPSTTKHLAANPPTAEEQKQIEALIERKRQEFNARRRVRKLD